jgi:preprotein translocase subunit Sss1
MKATLKFMGIGFELVGIVLASLYLGTLLDEHFLWGGFGVAGVLLIGTVGWIVHVVYWLMKMQKRDIK